MKNTGTEAKIIGVNTRREFIKQGGLALVAFSLELNRTDLIQYTTMTTKKQYDVIIIGGSYSGLSAALALGRALRDVLVIDDGKPCNRTTPFSHNFITQDGKTPQEISSLAKDQINKYENVVLKNGLAVSGSKTKTGFEIQTSEGEVYFAKKLIFATGIKDIHPGIDGLAQCWGISILHCPYCHGYEIRNEKTGILSNGDIGFELAKLISNWTKNLTLFTNGLSTLTTEQYSILRTKEINIVEKEIKSLKHTEGHLHHLVFNDGSIFSLSAMYTRLPFVQSCQLPESMGCEITKEGYIKTNSSQMTTSPGIYACGDNSSHIRTLANAVAMGTITGMALNKELINESF